MRIAKMLDNDSECFLTGIVDNPDGSIKALVGAHSAGRYVLVQDPALIKAIKHRWGILEHCLLADMEPEDWKVKGD